MLDHLVHLSVTGVLIASLLSLAAVGLSLSFGVARFANVAHPDFMMLGAYATFAYNVVLGWSFWAAAALGITTALIIGVAVAWLAFDKLPVSGNVQLLVVSIGVSFVLRHVALLIFGATPAQFAVPLQRPWVWGPVRLTAYQIATLLVAGALILGVHLLLTRTGPHTYGRCSGTANWSRLLPNAKRTACRTTKLTPIEMMRSCTVPVTGSLSKATRAIGTPTTTAATMPTAAAAANGRPSDTLSANVAYAPSIMKSGCATFANRAMPKLSESPTAPSASRLAIRTPVTVTWTSSLISSISPRCP